MSLQDPTIAIDLRGLDRLNVGNGQFRYCVDLIDGLWKLSAECRFIVIGSLPSPPEAIRHVFEHDDRWRYLPVRLRDFRGAFYLEQLLSGWLLLRQHVDVLHTLHTQVPLLSSAKRVVTIYDMMSELFPEYRERVVSRPYRLFKYAVKNTGPFVLAISNTTAADLERFWGVPASRVAVIYLCSSPEAAGAIPSEAETAANGTRGLILSPYNLEPRKNLLSLLRAMVEVRRSHPDAHLVLFGRAALTAEREEAFRKAVDALGLNETVSLTGFVSDAELTALYRRASLFVFPSLYEGFGLPVLEAMAAGTCTVARNQSAMAEVLGDAGVQVETADPALLASAMSAVLADAPRRAALGRAGQVRAARFTQQAMAQGTLAAYMRVLGRHHTAGALAPASEMRH
jgi:glycosyltransferase involved in cell wall biosynthesis